MGEDSGLHTDNAWIASLVRNNRQVDWTRAHRRDVYTSGRAVKMVLRRRKILGEQFTFILKPADEAG